MVFLSPTNKIIYSPLQLSPACLQTATSDVNVVVEYTLKPTPEVPVDKLQQAELDSKLFIRVESDKMPYWQGGPE